MISIYLVYLPYISLFVPWKQNQSISTMNTLSQVSFQAKGVYYKAGEGPPLEELDDAWSAWFLWSQTDTW